MRIFRVLLLLIPILFFGLDVKFCAISDLAKHEANQKLLNSIIKQELAALGPKKTAAEQANYLSHRITQIANALLKDGFATDAYKNPQLEVNSVVSFDCFPLWEGENNQSIPLTFFVYVWPSEEFALQSNSSNPGNIYYGSIIHSHPIPCALAVLDGTLIQRNYELVASDSIDRVVRLTDEDVFQKCEGAVDDLSEPFIHQIYAKDSGSKPTLSLHVYGLPSQEKVMASFKETSSSHSYSRVLQKDGIVKVVSCIKGREFANQSKTDPIVEQKKIVEVDLSCIKSHP